MTIAKDGDATTRPVTPSPRQVATVATLDEMLRTKAFLLYDRNATRDFVDFAALSNLLPDAAVEGLRVCEYREPDGAEGIARALVGHVHPDLVLPPGVERRRDEA